MSAEHLTPREAADELSAERWDDERRERYAAAMHSKRTGDLVTPWDRLSPDLQALWLLRADAAMSVADAEIRDAESEAGKYQFLWNSARERAGNLADENARVRAELDRAAERIVDVTGENARLRAELGYEELGRQNDRETAQIAMDSLNATIARVRKWAETTEHGAAAAQVRAVLGERGEQ